MDAQTPTKSAVIDKWKYAFENGTHLWRVQAFLNYKVIKENSIEDALRILRADFEKHKNMGIASFIGEAIHDLVCLKEAD